MPRTLRWLMFGLYGKFFAVALWRGACYAGAGASPAPYNGLCLFCTGFALRFTCCGACVTLGRGQAPHPTMVYVWFVREILCGCLVAGRMLRRGGGKPRTLQWLFHFVGASRLFKNTNSLPLPKSGIFCYFYRLKVLQVLQHCPTIVKVTCFGLGFFEI